MAAIWFLCLVLILFHWQKPWYPGCPDKLCEPHRYSKVIPIVNQYQPFFASNYQMASYLWKAKKTPVYKIFDMSRNDFFDTFEQSKPNGKMFYLAKHLETNLPTWISEKGYKVENILNIDEDLVLLKVYQL